MFKCIISGTFTVAFPYTSYLCKAQLLQEDEVPSLLPELKASGTCLNFSQNPVASVWLPEVRGRWPATVIL